MAIDFGKIKNMAGTVLPDGVIKSFINSGGSSMFSPSGDITDLMSAINEAAGIARPNQFIISMFLPREFVARNAPFIFSGPTAYGLDRKSSSVQITMACEISQIPARSIATTEHRMYGPMRTYGYGHTFAPVDMTFRVHNNMIERRFFEAWQESTVSSTTYDANYYDEYTNDIVIHQFGPPEATGSIIDSLLQGGTNLSLGRILGQARGLAKGLSGKFEKGAQIANHIGMASSLFGAGQKMQPMISYTLNNAFPQIISPLILDHGQNDSYHRQTVTFVYNKWTSSALIKPAPPSSDSPAFNANLLGPITGNEGRIFLGGDPQIPVLAGGMGQVGGILSEHT